MSYYVQRSSIDWQYDEADVQAAGLVALANQRLAASNHTAETFEQTLRTLAAQHPQLCCHALIEDGFRGLRLFHAEQACVIEVEVEERPEDALDTPTELPLDEMAEVTLIGERDAVVAALQAAATYAEDVDPSEQPLQLPIQYRDERALRAVMDRVASCICAAAEPFVAETDDARFLVELRPGLARVARLEAVTERELVNRLRSGQIAPIPEAPLLDNSKYEQTVYLPEEMLARLRTEAARTDRSLSYMLQFAVRETVQQIAACATAEQLAARVPTRDSRATLEMQKQTLYFPGAMLKALRAEAQRLDVSLSRILRSAWHLALPRIETLPSAE